VRYDIVRRSNGLVTYPWTPRRYTRANLRLPADWRYRPLLTGSNNRVLVRYVSSFVLVAVLGALVLAGCGGTSHAKDAASADVTGVTGTTTSATVASGDSTSVEKSASGADTSVAHVSKAGTDTSPAGSAGTDTTGHSRPSASGSHNKPTAHGRSRSLAESRSHTGPAGGAGGSGTTGSESDTGSSAAPSPSTGVPFTVPGGSMEPTYEAESTVYYDPAATHPQIGDVIVYYVPVGATDSSCATVMAGGAACADSRPGLTTSMAMKRVVGLPGDTIAINEGRVIRNGQPESEPPTLPCGKEAGCNFPTPITVPAGEYYVLGDNRGLYHEDSRVWGGLPQAAIIGTVEVK
jgi:signal peptidase I